MDDDFAYGLSAKNRNYIVGIVFFALLILGPVQPYGMIIRVSYLAAIPSILWLVLRYVGDKLDMAPSDNDRLSRGITAAIAGMLLLTAYQSATASYHNDCSQTVRAGQGGYECVGDIVTLKGPDTGAAFMWFVFAGVAFRIATSRKSN